MSDCIRMDNVVKLQEGRRVLADVFLRVKQGECLIISGPPGSGKSMLARLAAGLEKPSAGEVFVLGKPMHEMSEDAAAAFRNRHVGLLTRGIGFLNTLTMLDNIAMPLLLRGETAAHARKKAKESLKAMGMLGAEKASPAQLRPLERHKAAVARMLTAQPEVLLLDDFGAELADTDELAGILHALCRFESITVVELTSAKKGLICGDRELTLGRGKIQEETT